jgi:hypothetical protein
VPSHGDMTDASVVEAYRGFLKALQVRVAELKREGNSAEDTAAQLRKEFADKYPGWQQSVRVEAAATVVYAELP